MLLLLLAQNAEALCKRFPFPSATSYHRKTHLRAQPSNAIWIPSKRIACLTMASMRGKATDLTSP